MFNPYRTYMEKAAGLPVLATEALAGATRGGIGGAVIGGLAGARKDEEGNRHILGGALKGGLIGTAGGAAGGAAVGAAGRYMTRLSGVGARAGARHLVGEGDRLVAAGNIGGADEFYQGAKLMRDTSHELRRMAKQPFGMWGKQTDAMQAIGAEAAKLSK